MDAEKYKAFKAQLSGGGVQAIAAPQLFPTPEPVASYMVELAGIGSGDRVLEPSAGTGALVKAIGNERGDLVAVEINQALAHGLLRSGVSGLTVRNDDFLECAGSLGLFDRIVMNPPFVNGEDIKHILLARTLLNPGGVLVALCANGPRQQRALQSIADYWEVLPEGSFKQAGTLVNVALLVLSEG